MLFPLPRSYTLGCGPTHIPCELALLEEMAVLDMSRRMSLPAHCRRQLAGRTQRTTGRKQDHKSGLSQARDRAFLLADVERTLRKRICSPRRRLPAEMRFYATHCELHPEVIDE